MTTTDFRTAERARIIARQCTDCGAPPSAGRLRCDPCHTQQRKRASDG